MSDEIKKISRKLDVLFVATLIKIIIGIALIIIVLNISYEKIVGIVTQPSDWNVAEIARVDRECKLLCTGYDTYISVPSDNGCSCCYEEPELEPFAKCIYTSLEGY